MSPASPDSTPRITPHTHPVAAGGGRRTTHARQARPHSGSAFHRHLSGHGGHRGDHKGSPHPSKDGTRNNQARSHPDKKSQTAHSHSGHPDSRKSVVTASLKGRVKAQGKASNESHASHSAKNAKANAAQKRKGKQGAKHPKGANQAIAMNAAPGPSAHPSRKGGGTAHKHHSGKRRAHTLAARGVHPQSGQSANAAHDASTAPADQSGAQHLGRVHRADTQDVGKESAHFQNHVGPAHAGSQAKPNPAGSAHQAGNSAARAVEPAPAANTPPAGGQIKKTTSTKNASLRLHSGIKTRANARRINRLAQALGMGHGQPGAQAQGLHPGGASHASQSLGAPTQSAQTAIAHPPDSAQWRQAFAQKAAQWLSNGQSTQAQVQLHPPQLGQLNVSLNLGANQNVAVVFNTDNGAVQQAINQSLPELSQQLGQHGLSMDMGQSGAHSNTSNSGGERDRGRYSQRRPAHPLPSGERVSGLSPSHPHAGVGVYRVDGWV